MQDEPNIGARLRVLRNWRGLTIRELADLSAVSRSQISYIERGDRMLDRRSQIAALAKALRVSDTELTGLPHISPDAEQSAPHNVVPLLREALTGNTLDDPARDQARPLSELEAALKGDLVRLNDRADFARRGELAAGVFEELHVHVATGDEASSQRALELLTEACEAVGMTLRFLGYNDLAYIAATRAMEAAERVGDPIIDGQVAYLRMQLMPKASWDRPLDIAVAAAERLEPHVGSSRLGLETYGMLHLIAGLTAAAANNRDLANEHLAEASALACRTGDNEDAWSAFGPTNVGIWGVAISMEHGDYDKAVKLSRSVDPNRLPHRERRAMYYADTGRALAHLSGRHNDAVEYLQVAERIAPQRIRNNALVQETITYLLNKHMRTPHALELRGMAGRMGVLQ